MDSFNYLSVLLSIVLGLAIAQILQGFRGIILNRGHIKLYFPSLIWAALVLLIVTQEWWASFGMRLHADWNFGAFFIVILQAVCSYMAAALVLPNIPEDQPVDLRSHYFAHKAWLFGSLLASCLFSVTKDLVLYGHLPGRMNAEFHLIFALAVGAGALTNREWFHKILAPSMSVLFLLYIGLLFSHL